MASSSSCSALPQAFTRSCNYAFKHEIMTRVRRAKICGHPFVPLKNSSKEMKHGRECIVCWFSNERVKKCSGCRWASYCSRACQKNDWKWHKEFCCPDFQLPQHVVGIPYEVIQSASDESSSSLRFLPRTRELPSFQVAEFWYDCPYIVPLPKLCSEDSRFGDVVHNVTIYCDGFCDRSFNFNGAGFGGAGAYGLVPQHWLAECSSWSETIVILKKLYTDCYWNASWLCASCWQRMYWEQDRLELGISEVRKGLRVVNERLDALMRI